VYLVALVSPSSVRECECECECGLAGPPLLEAANSHPSNWAHFALFFTSLHSTWARAKLYQSAAPQLGLETHALGRTLWAWALPPASGANLNCVPAAKWAPSSGQMGPLFGEQLVQSRPSVGSSALMSVCGVYRVYRVYTQTDRRTHLIRGPIWRAGCIL